MKYLLTLAAVCVFMSTVFVGCSHFTGKTAGQSLDDTVITGDIKAALIKDPELKTFAIDVSSYQGNVTLSGLVPNKAAEQRLVQYAKDTKGVKSVKTNLQMAGVAPGKAGSTTDVGRTMAAPGPAETKESSMERSGETTTTTEESTTETNK